MSNAKHVWLAVLAVACLGAGCTNEIKVPVRVVGRVAFPDADGCDPAVGSQSISWTDCHLFKGQFDAVTGNPIVANSWAPGALRPLASTVVLSYTDTKGNECGAATVTTDLEGYFNVVLNGCGAGTATRVNARVMLAHELRQETGDRHGTLHGVWPKNDADALFPEISSDQTALDESFAYITTDGTLYTTPEFRFTFEVASEPAEVSGEALINTGLTELAASSEDDPFDYLRQMLSAFQTMVQLHDKARAKYSDSNQYYDAMFVDGVNPTWGPTFTVAFNARWAFGGRGGISIYGPDAEGFNSDVDGNGSPDGTSRIWWLLSDTGTLAHEFGHTLHGGLAGRSFTSDYAFGNPLMRADGTEYDWGHGGGQYQEMGTSFTEGLASTLGQFLLNGCEGSTSSRPNGGAYDIADNMWNADSSCDALDGCSFHHVRWHLRHRGVQEGSLEWTLRVDRLISFTDVAATQGQGRVMTNSETRISEWGCDVLDRGSDVSYAIGRAQGLSFLSDFTYNVAELLDGRGATADVRHWSTDPDPEAVTLEFPQFLNAMASFCPDCGSLPGGSQWGASYNSRRISITGALSPQTMSRWIVSQGLATEAVMGNVLKANFMEDSF